MDERVIPIAAAIIAALFGLIIAGVCGIMWTNPQSVDFASFWAAGRMVVEGAGAAIYDVEAHQAVERTVVDAGLNPFPYPPPFALLVAPFGALPFGAAFTAWVVVTAALFTAAARAWMPARVALAQPGALITGFIGQNAFLTCGLFMAGTKLLRSQPFLGGAVLGVLIIKPQLALLLPVAVIASRQWRAVGGAATSIAALAIAALPLVGFAGYAGFVALVGGHASYLAASRWPWHEIASVYAFLRYFAVPAPVALAAHGAVALAAAALVWWAWRGDRRGKEAMLAAATLLISPYLMSYEGLLLALPVGWLLVEARRPALAVGAWGLALVAAGSVFGLYSLPNMIPLAALLSLGAIAPLSAQSR